MTRGSVATEVSKGVCRFCDGQFEKSKMSQHLKFCKERKAKLAAADEQSSEKTRLFHLVVEGHYNPDYWLHIELPADTLLADLDSFLRSIWLECCGHLSAFIIAGVHYSWEPDDYPFFLGSTESVTTEGEPEPGYDFRQEVAELLEDDPLDSELYLRLPEDMLSRIKEFDDADELVAYLHEELKAIPKLTYEMIRADLEAYQRITSQSYALEHLIREFEDRSMYVKLEKVLKSKKKFAYEYDFGSTTYLDLRLLGEREGARYNDKRTGAVRVLARNLPPGVYCEKCGKSATKFLPGSYGGYGALCDACAKQVKYVEWFLPIINSPRVGVCGYTGGSLGDV